MSTARRYVSPQRERAASETRTRVLAVATEELIRRGFHATTVASLARAAEVSPQTIYNSIGGKADVVKAAYDVLLAGDDEPVPISARPEMRAVFEQPDAAATVRAYVAVGCRMYDRVGPLLGGLWVEGPGSDRELAGFLESIESERRVGNTVLVRHLEQRFGLPTPLTASDAADIVWTATSFEVVDRLVRRCGWKMERFEDWLGTILVSNLTDVS